MPKSNRKPEPLDIVDDQSCSCATNCDGSEELPHDADCPVHGYGADGDIPYYFESPESSTIEQALYDPDTQTLRVTFKRGKGKTETYQYDKIEPMLWADFYSAPSKGSFFALNIRPRYVGRRT